MKCIGYKKPDLTDKPSGDCEGCPKWYNAMPGPNKRPKDSKTQKCIDNGCTKIVW